MSNEQIIGFLLLLGIALLYRRGPQAKNSSRLDRVVWRWGGRAYTERDLTGSFLVMGQSGSGKTTGAGSFIRDHLLAIPDSGGLVITSKHKERSDWLKAAERHGRLKDIIVFASDQPNEINFLDQMGGDPSNTVHAMGVISEMFSGRRGHGEDPFWAAASAELFYNTVTILKLAGKPISATEVQGLINGAAPTAAHVADAGWRKRDHWQTLEAAKANAKTLVQKMAMEKAYPFWVNVWPSKDPKLNSNVLAQAMSVLDQLTRPEVRVLLGSGTNVNLDCIFQGKIIVCDTPLQTMGETGRLISACVKYAVQRKIMARDAKPEDPIAFVSIDEAHNHFSEYDPVVLAEQREHKGMAIYLTQGINAVEAIIGDKQARSLFTNFATKIFSQLGSKEDDAYACSLLPEILDIRTGGGPDAEGNFNPNFNEDWRPSLRPGSFMDAGLRAKDGIATAIVVGGQNFESGHRYAYVSFKQG